MPAPWRWVSHTFIDHRKGRLAFGTTTSLVAACAGLAIGRGSPPDIGSWLLIAAAAAMLPPTWKSWKTVQTHMQDNQEGEARPWEPNPDFVEPPSNVRRLGGE